jgi:hypothetical protein
LVVKEVTPPTNAIARREPVRLRKAGRGQASHPRLDDQFSLAHLRLHQPQVVHLTPPFGLHGSSGATDSIDPGCPLRIGNPSTSSQDI